MRIPEEASVFATLKISLSLRQWYKSTLKGVTRSEPSPVEASGEVGVSKGVCAHVHLSSYEIYLCTKIAQKLVRFET